MIDFNKMLKAMKPQSDEFDALNKLIKAYKNMPAIVDDDYPEARHRYESAMTDLLKAAKANGRTV